VAEPALVSRLRVQADWHPDAPLLCDQAGVTTARALVDLVDVKIRAYRSAGVGAGCRVGSLAWPAASFVSDVFAVLALGAVLAPLPRHSSAWELGRVEALASLTHVAVPLDSPRLPDAAGLAVDGRRLVPRRVAGEPALEQAGTAQLTSGTTGRLRVALRPVPALLVEAANYQTALGLEPGTVLACPVPLHHAYGFGLAVLAAPLAGATVHVLSPERPRRLFRDLIRCGATLFTGVPPMLRLLAESAGGRRPTAQVGFLTAGMPLDVRTAELVGTVLGGRLGEVYGTTETGPICVRPPGRWEAAVRSLGPPLPGVEVSLSGADLAGRSTPFDPAEAGQTGLITVRSPSAMIGYADGKRLDTAPVRDGFVTGDLGRWTEDGLVIVGRLTNCINVAGAKVSPEEVEAVLLEFPSVQSCLVDGVDDARLGQRIRATVTPGSVDLVALRQFCQERLSPPRLPHLFEAAARLQTTETGKVIRSRPNAG
jgi:acyl-CoA synthetase (AMP-forming)/AMP-acid ligase II